MRVGNFRLRADGGDAYLDGSLRNAGYPWITTVGATTWQPRSGRLIRITLERSAVLSWTVAEFFALIVALCNFVGEDTPISMIADSASMSQAVMASNSFLTMVRALSWRGKWSNWTPSGE